MKRLFYNEFEGENTKSMKDAINTIMRILELNGLETEEKKQEMFDVKKGIVHLKFKIDYNKEHISFFDV